VTTVERPRSATDRPSPRPPAARHPYVRRRVAVGLALLALVVGLAWGVTVSPFLTIDHVVVTGTHRLTAAQVDAAGGIHRGDSMFWFRPGQAATAIRALPFVARARVTRSWPHTVRVAVTEREPVAWFAQAGATFTTDATGRVLERVASAPAGLPRLEGLRRTAAPGGWIAPAGGAAAVGMLPALVRAATTTATLARDGSLTLHLVTGVELRLGPPVDVGVKVRAALAVLGALGNRVVSYVDVSVPTNPVAG